MNKESIIKEINGILSNKSISFKLNDQTLKKNFKELGADSLTLLEIIMAIEEKLNITLPDEELMNIKTAEDLINLINKNLK